MGLNNFGSFHDFCRDSTLPVCNLFPGFNYADPSGFEDRCYLTGISLDNGQYLGNLGSIIIASIAVVIATLLILLSERKQAAVGRREVQIFLFTYALIEICEIFTVGLFPLDNNVRIAFTSAHLGLIVASLWTLMLNAVVGYQLIDDGTPLSVGLIVTSALLLFLGTGYIALDTAFSWTGRFESSLSGNNTNMGLYILYQLAPIIFLIAFFILETYLVLRVLGEWKPMIYLISASLLFIIGQIFNYVVSIHICNATSGRINGALFETFFTLLSVIAVWIFWSSITEDDWPTTPNNPYP